MEYKVATITEYLNAVPEDRKEGMLTLYETIQHHLPLGFAEQISYGHISFIVPLSKYTAGYHCDPSQPLPFISIASQKNHVAIYHMGMYMDASLLYWFQKEFPKHSKKKLNMGKSCIRFSKTSDIPMELMAKLASKMTADEYIQQYTSIIQK